MPATQNEVFQGTYTGNWSATSPDGRLLYQYFLDANQVPFSTLQSYVDPNMPDAQIDYSYIGNHIGGGTFRKYKGNVFRNACKRAANNALKARRAQGEGGGRVVMGGGGHGMGDVPGMGGVAAGTAVQHYGMQNVFGGTPHQAPTPEALAQARAFGRLNNPSIPPGKKCHDADVYSRDGRCGSPHFLVIGPPNMTLPPVPRGPGGIPMGPGSTTAASFAPPHVGSAGGLGGPSSVGATHGSPAVPIAVPIADQVDEDALSDHFQQLEVTTGELLGDPFMMMNNYKLHGNEEICGICLPIRCPTTEDGSPTISACVSSCGHFVNIFRDVDEVFTDAEKLGHCLNFNLDEYNSKTNSMRDMIRDHVKKLVNINQGEGSPIWAMPTYIRLPWKACSRLKDFRYNPTDETELSYVAYIEVKRDDGSSDMDQERFLINRSPVNTPTLCRPITTTAGTPAPHHQAGGQLKNDDDDDDDDSSTIRSLMDITVTTGVSARMRRLSQAADRREQDAGGRQRGGEGRGQPHAGGAGQEEHRGPSPNDEGSQQRSMPSPRSVRSATTNRSQGTLLSRTERIAHARKRQAVSNQAATNAGRRRSERMIQRQRAVDRGAAAALRDSAATTGSTGSSPPACTIITDGQQQDSLQAPHGGSSSSARTNEQQDPEL